MLGVPGVSGGARGCQGVSGVPGGARWCQVVPGVPGVPGVSSGARSARRC